MSRFDLFFVILDECHAATDLYIAQHIINFHRFKEAGVEPDYNTQQLQAYLTYARGLKPQLTEEAREYLVIQYRNLRQADATGVSRSSYRITVRQLESMVRLSEALAKIHGEHEVLVKHVMEAAHLLKTSIVHVEQDNVDMEDDEEVIRQATQVEEKTDMDLDAVYILLTKPAPQDILNVPKQIVTLSGEQYQKIVQSILLQLRRQQRESQEAGMPKSRIVNWYMETMEDANQLETEEQVMHHRKIIKSVLIRLVKKENILLEMKDVTRLDKDELEDDEVDDPVLFIAPNYNMEADD
jgi:DNA replication licensing factor MCM6